MSKQKGLVPPLRFPEFHGAGSWEVKRLGEVSEVLDSMRKPIASSKRKSGTYPYYGASGIIDYINDYIFDERLLLIGEDGAKWGPFEKTAFIVEGKYWVNNHAHVLRPFAINDVLLENYLNSIDISIYITGAAPPKLTLDNLKSIRIPIPPVEEEQQKITYCLSSLDDLIQAEEKALEALKKHKKGLMQQLFPAPGETIPKMRFSEFRDAGAWEVKQLGDVAQISMGASPKSTTYNKKGIGLPLLQGNADIKNRISSPRIFTTQITKECFFDDILLSVRAPVGSVAKSIHHACIGRGIAAIRANKNNSQDFLYQWLLWYEPKWQNISQGGTFDSVNSNDIKQLSITIPRPPEQQKIADCLSSLDDLILAKSKRIDVLKLHKKGLMQQLFISV